MNDRLDRFTNPNVPLTPLSRQAETYAAQLRDSQEFRLYLEDLAEVVRTGAGARVLCKLLEDLGTFEPCWTDKNARLAKAVVLRDFGQSLLDDLAQAAVDVHDDIQRMLRIKRKLLSLPATSKEGD